MVVMVINYFFFRYLNFNSILIDILIIIVDYSFKSKLDLNNKLGFYSSDL